MKITWICQKLVNTLNTKGSEYYKPWELVTWGWWQPNGQEVHNHQEDDSYDDNETEQSPSGADKGKESNEVDTIMLGECGPVIESIPPTIKDEMQMMFIRLLFSQMMAEKLVEDWGIYSPWTIASLSDDGITVIFVVILRPCGLVGGRTSERGNQISIPAGKNLKLAVFMFMMMEHCFKPYKINCIKSRRVL